MKIDFRDYYNLENYLFNDVNQRFHNQGYIDHKDFHCILVWKANRAKYKNAAKIIKNGETYEEAAISFTKELYKCNSPENRFKFTVGKPFNFLLPTASAILTVLYPKEFTVYDYRACEFIKDKNKEKDYNKISGDLWTFYSNFINDVILLTPDLPLREKDKYIWGWSFKQDLDKAEKNLMEILKIN